MTWMLSFWRKLVNLPRRPAPMERKSLVLVLLALCVLFILEEELFHFTAFSTQPFNGLAKNLTRSSSDDAPPPSRLKARPIVYRPSGTRNDYAASSNANRHHQGNSGSDREVLEEGVVARGVVVTDNSEQLKKRGEVDRYGTLVGRRSGGSFPSRRIGQRRINYQDDRRDDDEDNAGTTGSDDDDEEEDDDSDDEEEEDEEEELRWGKGREDKIGKLRNRNDNKDTFSGWTDYREVEKVIETEEEEEARLKLSPYIYREEDEVLKFKKYDPTKMTDIRYLSFYLPWGKKEHEKKFNYCHYKNCAFVNNMSHADLVVFKASDIRDHLIPNFYRPKNQRWLMYTADPAIKRYAFTRADVLSSFNWTMTYQLDADVAKIFGRLKKRPPPPRDYGQLFDNKPRMAAWFVSHCETWSKREDYIKRMQKYMEIDIFGQCGNLSCGANHYRTHDSTLCLPMLTNEYKFYMSFENSFCPDYVTEKFFKLFQNVQVIPVVRGGVDYKRYFPRHIFVDAADFKSPEDLAKYLVGLANDKDRYVPMLTKKDQWVVTRNELRHCRVCEHINTHWNHVGYHPNLRHKFNGQPLACWSPNDL